MAVTLFPRLFLIVAGFWLSTSLDAEAYIDPGSSSYLFQLLIGALTAVAFFFGSIKRRVQQGWHRLFQRRRSGRIDPAQAPKNETSSNA
jgi:hypothetical protein